ncbi:DUF3225 domain-containing protein [Streptomyces sp. 3MP-14]|uniref:DUF3225 domain-containing protein n=1 Tax=Streptomyces mimosae TaxID=2586635 RepID=A0A5N6AIJ1_9ACTN|nr:MULTISPECIES: AtzH-like domain-containing protein [Streptomyces]KAB8168531.1 DUF3225 domain-containing protein [Streptomyces mimosae]KAB8178188.1 DUF3225 domain-containing protein [Streptomyces sp. 3MP-14]
MSTLWHPDRTSTHPEVLGDGPLPPGLWEAFLAYDRALLGNDVPALDAAFAPGDATLRADGTGVSRGHATIAAFRAARPAAPDRRLVRVHVRLPADGVALLVAEVASPTGAPGLQTQLWQRVEGRWRVAAAHVTAPARPLDTSVWRVAGAPLVAPTASGPLDGLGVAVKDLFAVAGQPVGAGVPAFLAERAPEARHASAVAALLDAGASLLGIAQTDELAYSVSGVGGRWGTPAHPTAPGRVPGGSTNGPAVAVARGEAAVGLGTDTAGSIRVPGSYLGLWGLRTSTGLVDTAGLLPLAPSFDAVGWLTADGATLLRVAEALLPDVPERDGRPGELVTVPALTARAEPEVAEAVRGAAEALGAVPLDLDVDCDAWFEAFRVVQGFEAWRTHGAWVTGHPGALSGEVAARLAWAAGVTGAQHEAARAVLADAAAFLRAALADRVLLLPATATPAPPLADPEALAAARDRTLRLTCLASLAGLPALTMPAPGTGPGQPPLGLGLVGPAGRDLPLLRFALGAAATLAGDRPHHAQPSTETT